MTISANYTWNPTVDDICRQGMQLAGILPLGRTIDPVQAGHVRDMLQSTLKHLSTMGVGLTQLEATTFPMVIGQTTYTLPADTLDIDFPVMIAKPGETAQVRLERYSWEMFQEITEKATQSMPNIIYVEVTDVVKVNVWPVPDLAYTASYRRTRLIRDADSGSTVDLRPRWTEALVYSMAHKLALASSLGVERVKYLDGQAKEKTALARGREHESGDLQFVLDWSPFI